MSLNEEALFILKYGNRTLRQIPDSLFLKSEHISHETTYIKKEERECATFRPNKSHPRHFHSKAGDFFSPPTAEDKDSAPHDWIMRQRSSSTLRAIRGRATPPQKQLPHTTGNLQNLPQSGLREPPESEFTTC